MTSACKKPIRRFVYPRDFGRAASAHFVSMASGPRLRSLGAGDGSLHMVTSGAARWCPPCADGQNKHTCDPRQESGSVRRPGNRSRPLLCPGSARGAQALGAWLASTSRRSSGRPVPPPGPAAAWQRAVLRQRILVTRFDCDRRCRRPRTSPARRQPRCARGSPRPTRAAPALLESNFVAGK